MNLHDQQQLVSIIIPTYNRAGLLAEAINSALTQTYPHVEVIVVDDGSRDNTPDVAQSFGQRIRYIRQSNAGVSAARNRGFAESKGAYIGFLDDDDLFFEDKIALQVDALQRDPDTPLANCNYFHMDERGRLLSHNGILPARETLRHLLLANFIWMSAPLIRRDALMKVGLFDPALSLAADLDMWLRLARLNDFACIQKPLGAYRIQQGSMVTKAALAEQDCMAALQKAYEHLTNSPADTHLKAHSEAQWRLWFASNYLNVGMIADFQRNYRRAAECAPDMLDDTAFMTRRLSQDIMNYRVHDSQTFCDQFFAQLPEEVAFLRAYREAIGQRIEISLALQEIVDGDVDAGRRRMAAVWKCYPTLRQNPMPLREIVFEAAMCARDGGQSYLADIRAHIDMNDDAVLAGVLDDVQHDINVWEGYLAYQNGDYHDARRKMLAGVSRQPNWLKNRGVAATLVRSLLAH